MGWKRIFDANVFLLLPCILTSSVSSYSYLFDRQVPSTRYLSCASSTFTAWRDINRQVRQNSKWYHFTIIVRSCNNWLICDEKRTVNWLVRMTNLEPVLPSCQKLASLQMIGLYSSQQLGCRDLSRHSATTSCSCYINIKVPLSLDFASAIMNTIYFNLSELFCLESPKSISRNGMKMFSQNY